MGFGLALVPTRWASSPVRRPRPAGSVSSGSQDHLLRLSPLQYRFMLILPEERANLRRATFKASAYYSTALQGVDNVSDDVKAMKENMDKNCQGDSRDVYETVNVINENVTAAAAAKLGAKSYLQFNLLMDNLHDVEDILSGTDLIMLERDILVHIKQLGALKLFRACLSRNFSVATTLESNFVETSFDEHNDRVIVRTAKARERKLRRKGASERVKEETTALLPSSVTYPGSRSKRASIAQNESKMSEGVKEVARLERARQKLEEQSGQPASYARWAEAVGIEQKTLKQRLQFGWFCRDKLIKSTRSLVMYLARNYRGMGIAFEDLIQAGNVGVLNGAERFDSMKGYKFSTYVRYWIKKSILALIARHRRGIQIPVRMENMIQRIQKARRAFHNKRGRHPQDEETAKLTGLSLANVRLARKCSLAVGSIDQEIGNGWCTKFAEVTPDQSIKSPYEIIIRQQMRESLFQLLEKLHPRERRYYC
uniref:RNA polymerase sigma factor sigC n=1 Tax=Ananas comosus var. bracteatus TaxID=296719 RepID=A0A6V7P012_ANACO|nr:unnamed protein product [Ananas comosus var. bracteatus]